MSARKLQFTGVYFDGLSARKHPVVFSLSPRELTLTLPEGQTRHWSYTDLCLTKGASGKPPFHLEHTVNEPQGKRLETLIVNDPAFLGNLRGISAVSLHSTFRPVSGGKHVALGLAVLVVPMFLYGLWTVAIPKLSDRVAMQVPVAWEEKLGERVMQSLPRVLAPSSKPDQQKALEAIAGRLLSVIPDQPYKIRVHISSLDVVNAVAFPGGHILVFQGLLNKAESPEELAGVLAHEIQHVLLRHSTRAIIRSMASNVLLSLLTGDMNATMDVALKVAGELEGLAHSRKMEEQADRKGMDMILAAKIDPVGMIRMFEKIQKEEQGRAPNEEPGKSGPEDDPASWVEYLSTHPAGKDRVSELQKQVAMAGKKSYTPLLPGLDWKALIHQKVNPKKSNNVPSMRQTYY